MVDRLHYDDVLGLEKGLTIKYSFESSLGPTENYRYKQSIVGRIMLQNEQGKDLQEVGRLYLDRLLFSTGVNSGWDHFSIFDTEQYLLELGECIWNFEKQDYVEPLNKFFGDDLMEWDILYLHSLEVLAVSAELAVWCPGYLSRNIIGH
ncbi:MAG TPA: hypothetical protein VF609_03995 [Flavisolibacter sp.]|jgi:hypothetical protein